MSLVVSLFFQPRCCTELLSSPLYRWTRATLTSENEAALWLPSTEDSEREVAVEEGPLCVQYIVLYLLSRCLLRDGKVRRARSE